MPAGGDRGLGLAMGNPAQAIVTLIAVLLFAAAWLALWLLVLKVLATLGGWRDLAIRYRVEALPAHLPARRWRSVRLNGWCGYNHCVTLAVGQDALYLSTVFFLRPGHAVLRIPWEDLVRVGNVGPARRQMERYAATGATEVSVDLPPKTAARLRELAGDFWPQ
jgi:hypothetical protein